MRLMFARALTVAAAVLGGAGAMAFPKLILSDAIPSQEQRPALAAPVPVPDVAVIRIPRRATMPSEPRLPTRAPAPKPRPAPKAQPVAVSTPLPTRPRPAVTAPARPAPSSAPTPAPGPTPKPAPKPTPKPAAQPSAPTPAPTPPPAAPTASAAEPEAVPVAAPVPPEEPTVRSLLSVDTTPRPTPRRPRTPTPRVPIVVPPLLGAPAGTPVSDEDLEPEAELPNREDDGDAEQPVPGVGSGPVGGVLGSG